MMLSTKRESLEHEYNYMCLRVRDWIRQEQVSKPIIITDSNLERGKIVLRTVSEARQYLADMDDAIRAIRTLEHVMNVPQLSATA